MPKMLYFLSYEHATGLHISCFPTVASLYLQYLMALGDECPLIREPEVCDEQMGNTNENRSILLQPRLNFLEPFAKRGGEFPVPICEVFIDPRLQHCRSSADVRRCIEFFRSETVHDVLPFSWMLNLRALQLSRAVYRRVIGKPLCSGGERWEKRSNTKKTTFPGGRGCTLDLK